jgi:SAM-dependent methyltransferase
MTVGARRQTAACPICGEAAPPSSILAPRVVHHCPGCGLRFRPDLGPEWSEDYGPAEEGYAGRHKDDLLDRRAQRELEARRRAEFVTSHVRAGTLLEVGCAAGEFLDAARGHGFEVTGVEASPMLSSIARERYGVTVQQGLGEDAIGSDRRFEVICTWHVLEHSREPKQLLESVGRALAPGGLLFLEVPNIESAGARSLGHAWPQLGFEDHASFFSPGSLEVALRRTGLDPVVLTTVLTWEYLSVRERVRPRRIAGRLHRAVIGRTLRARHPSNGDLLRAVARNGSSS